MKMFVLSVFNLPLSKEGMFGAVTTFFVSLILLRIVELIRGRSADKVQKSLIKRASITREKVVGAYRMIQKLDGEDHKSKVDKAIDIVIKYLRSGLIHDINGPHFIYLGGTKERLNHKIAVDRVMRSSGLADIEDESILCWLKNTISTFISIGYVNLGVGDFTFHKYNGQATDPSGLGPVRIFW